MNVSPMRRMASFDKWDLPLTYRRVSPWDLFLPLGVVDVKVAALGEDWSGLKFVRRRENRCTFRHA